MRKIGINLDAIGGLTDEEYIRRLASLGFEGTFSMVLDEERQKNVARLCEKYNVRCETLHSPFKKVNDIWTEGEEGDAYLDSMKKTVDHCVIAGADIAISHLSSGMNPPATTDIGRARFEKLIEYASKKGVKIAFENQRKIFNLAWTLETFDESVAGFCWDCGHEACFTPGREYMPIFGDRLICVHIHDNFCVYNSDDHLLPFDGKIDMDRVASHICASGFEGTLMLEVIAGNSNVYEGVSPESYLERAAEAVRKLTNKLD